MAESHQRPGRAAEPAAGVAGDCRFAGHGRARRARRLRSGADSGGAQRRAGLSAIPRRAQARRTLDAGRGGPLPAAEGDRGALGRDGDSAPAGHSASFAGGGHVRIAAIRSRNCRPRAAASIWATTSPGRASPATWPRSCGRWTCWCCPASSARGCRWSCWRRWPPACRWWPRDVAGIPEAIRHGRDGVLVTPGDRRGPRPGDCRRGWRPLRLVGASHQRAGASCPALLRSRHGRRRGGRVSRSARSRRDPESSRPLPSCGYEGILP